MVFYYLCSRSASRFLVHNVGHLDTIFGDLQTLNQYKNE